MSNTKVVKPEKKTTKKEAWIVMALTVIILIGGSNLGLQYRMLMVAEAIVAGAMNVFALNIPWKDCEEALAMKMKTAIPTLCTMWLIGGLIATMIFAGSVPMVIYYGFMVISPKFIYVTAFLLCLIMSTLTGSSWTSAGTGGVAMYGMALGMDANLCIVVGAIIAGAIFGDKMSPLSETTNMAPACVGTGLFDHIGSMMYDTLPAAIISAIVFTVAGLTGGLETVATDATITTLMDELMTIYNFCWWRNILMILPFAFVLWSAVKKKPMVPVLSIVVFMCIFIGVITNGFSLASGMTAAYSGFSLSYATTLPADFEASTFLTKILVRGGCSGQSSIVTMCFAGFAAAAMISRGGYLDCVLESFVTNIKSRVGCVAAALGTNLVIMIATGTAYVAFIMVTEMYKKAFVKNRVGMPVLSRCLEDIGTCFGCLIPWSLSGAYYAGLFDGMAIWGSGGYALWTVLPYTTVIIAFVLAFTGIGMYKMSDEEAEAILAEMEAEATA